MSCLVCQRPEFVEQREEWGCDKPTREAQLTVECWACRNEHAAHARFCELCDGARELPVHECPRSLLNGWRAGVLELAMLVDKGIDPFGVPVDDWPATLHEAIMFVLGEKYRIDEQAIERAREG